MKRRISVLLVLCALLPVMLTGQSVRAEEGFDGRLPAIYLTTREGAPIVSLEEYLSCTVDAEGTGEDDTFSGIAAEIRVRGNSSAYYGDVEKILANSVPYRLRFEKKRNLFGLHRGEAFRNWVLLPAGWDLVRNELALRMARAIFGDTAYVSDSCFVHVYVNGDFKGVYVLCEQNQVNRGRVNVNEPDPENEDPLVGYYLELDNYAWSEPDNAFFTLYYENGRVRDVRGDERRFVPAEYSVKSDIASAEQLKFIRQYLKNVFKILYQAVEKRTFYTFDEDWKLTKLKTKDPQEAVARAIDLDSAVDMYLLYELVHDYDCGEGSFFLCVDFSEESEVKRLQFTSPWDFGWAYADSTDRYWAGAFCEESFVKEYGDRSNPWFILLAKEDWFRALCKKRWGEVREGVIAAMDWEKAFMESHREALSKDYRSSPDSARHVLEWLDDRMRWMDKRFKP